MKDEVNLMRKCIAILLTVSLLFGLHSPSRAVFAKSESPIFADLAEWPGTLPAEAGDGNRHEQKAAELVQPSVGGESSVITAAYGEQPEARKEALTPPTLDPLTDATNAADIRVTSRRMTSSR